MALPGVYNTKSNASAMQLVKRAPKKPWPPFPLYPGQVEVHKLLDRSTHFKHPRYKNFDFAKIGINPSEFDKPKRFILNVHRQWGKDLCFALWCVKFCRRFPRSNVFYLFPTKERSIEFWFENPIDIEDCGETIVECIPKEWLRGSTYRSGLVESKGAIRFENGSRILMRGMNGSLFGTRTSKGRGPSPHMLVFSEASADEVDPAVLAGYVAGGYRKDHIELYASTSNGKNHFYDTFMEGIEANEQAQKAGDPDPWYVRQYNIDETTVDGETPIVTQDEYWEYAKRYGKDMADQEFYNKFTDVRQGGIFTDSLKLLRASSEKAGPAGGIVSSIPIEPHLPTYTGWDLGQKNATVVVYYQLDREGHVRIVDCQAYTRTNMRSVAADVLAWQRKHGVVSFNNHFLPHDAKQATQHTEGYLTPQNIQEVLRDSGLDPTRVIRKVGDKDISIQCVLDMFMKFRISKDRCQRLLDYMGSYRRVYNPSERRHEKKIYKDQKSFCTDYMDALQTGCMGLSRIVADPELHQEAVDEAQGTEGMRDDGGAESLFMGGAQRKRKRAVPVKDLDRYYHGDYDDNPFGLNQVHERDSAFSSFEEWGL